LCIEYAACRLESGRVDLLLQLEWSRVTCLRVAVAEAVCAGVALCRHQTLSPS